MLKFDKKHLYFMWSASRRIVICGLVQSTITGQARIIHQRKPLSASGKIQNG